MEVPEPDESLTPEQVRRAADELSDLLAERLPQRFYPSEGAWRVVLSATVARMGGLLDAITALADGAREPEVHVLLRSMYEHVVCFMWVSIHPRQRVHEWRIDTLRHRRKLHRDLADYGQPPLMADWELALAESGQDLPPVNVMAVEADAYWHHHVAGLHVNPGNGPKSFLTLEGLYLAIFRVGSRSAHATLEGLDYWAMKLPQDKTLVRLKAEAHSIHYAAMAVPLFAMALVVSHHVLGWPDADRVRAINDAMTGDA